MRPGPWQSATDSSGTAWRDVSAVRYRPHDGAESGAAVSGRRRGSVGGPVTCATGNRWYASSADGAAESMSVEGLRRAGPTQHSSGRSNTTAIPHPPTCGVVACRTLNLGRSEAEAAMRALRQRASAFRTCSRCCTLRTLSDPPAHAPSGPSSRPSAAAPAPSAACPPDSLC